MSDKVFVGKGEKKQTQYGELTKFGFTEKDLNTMKEHLSEKGWVNVVIKDGKNGQPYAQIDTWKPSGSTQYPQTPQAERAPKMPPATMFEGQDDMPF